MFLAKIIYQCCGIIIEVRINKTSTKPYFCVFSRYEDIQVMVRELESGCLRSEQQNGVEEPVVDIVKFITAVIYRAIIREKTNKCQGCLVGEPSQLKHDCLVMTNAVSAITNLSN